MLILWKLTKEERNLDPLLSDYFFLTHLSNDPMILQPHRRGFLKSNCKLEKGRMLVTNFFFFSILFFTLSETKSWVTFICGLVIVLGIAFDRDQPKIFYTLQNECFHGVFWTQPVCLSVCSSSCVHLSVCPSVCKILIILCLELLLYF